MANHRAYFKWLWRVLVTHVKDETQSKLVLEMAEDNSSKGGLHLFGRRLAKIPCYRDSLMSGIGGGITVGLGTFLFTSNVKRATNVGFGSFLGLTLIAWGWCRSRIVTVDEKTIRQAIQKKILTEGTELEQKIESQAKDV